MLGFVLGCALGLGAPKFTPSFPISSGTVIFTLGRYFCTFCSTIFCTKTQLSRSNLRWPPFTTPSMLSRSISCTLRTRPRILLTSFVLMSSRKPRSAWPPPVASRSSCESKGLPPRIFSSGPCISSGNSSNSCFSIPPNTLRNSRRTSLCTLPKPVLSFSLMTLENPTPPLLPLPPSPSPSRSPRPLEDPPPLGLFL